MANNLRLLDNVTKASTGVDANGNVIVRSTGTPGQVLRSVGTDGAEATWGDPEVLAISAPQLYGNILSPFILAAADVIVVGTTPTYDAGAEGLCDLPGIPQGITPGQVVCVVWAGGGPSVPGVALGFFGQGSDQIAGSASSTWQLAAPGDYVYLLATLVSPGVLNWIPIGSSSDGVYCCSFTGIVAATPQTLSLGTLPGGRGMGRSLTINSRGVPITAGTLSIVVAAGFGSNITASLLAAVHGGTFNQVEHIPSRMFGNGGNNITGLTAVMTPSADYAGPSLIDVALRTW